REVRSAEVAEQRVTQVRGKEQLNAAKRQVATEIHQRLKDYPEMPAAVANLLQDGWKDVLLLSYLRKGVDSDEWKNAILRMDDLIWSVHPKSNYEDRQKLLKIIPELLRELRAGLSGISYDQHKMARVFKDLQTAHINCLKQSKAIVEGKTPPPPTKPAAEKPAKKVEMSPLGRRLDTLESDTEIVIDVDEDSHHIPELADVSGSKPQAASKPTSKPASSRLASSFLDEIVLEDEHSNESDLAANDEFTEKAQALEVGTWVDLIEEDGNKVRAKLSWKSDITGNYMFVNRKGQKIADMSLQGLALRFRQNTVQELEDVGVPLMDRALNAMMQALKNTASNETDTAQ
ncbi:MAG: DUF1631 domain-containing protein, partial [gamma proteobacterium symbiont of Bathyaustriella thionipta]|nr:DUF1631 domain-containing protein [gamma proteobacterium symbiont of Bathyaustriella thionipta]